MSALIEECRFFLACQLMKEDKHEKAIEAFQQLKSPYASFYQVCKYRIDPWEPDIFWMGSTQYVGWGGGGFLWAYLKSRVYAHKPRMLNGLKEAFHWEIRPIGHQLLAHVVDDFKKGLENCIQEVGRHPTDIFKT